MLKNRILLGGARRRTGFGKGKIGMLILAAALVFLAIWQMPIRQKTVFENIEIPIPREIK